MAITVKFYKNFKKRDNSTLQPLQNAPADDLLCTLKDGCDILNPSFDVLKISDNPATLGYNYAYIAAFNRYYTINNWSWNMGLWVADMSVDVLASYKNDIGNLTKYIVRAASEKNGYITDMIYPTYVNPNISFITVNNPFRNNNGSFLIGILGKPQPNVPSVGGINYYKLTWSQMRDFITYLTGGTFANAMKDDAAGLTSAVVKTLVNPTDYIESCLWFPFDIAVNNSYENIQPQIGWWDNLTPIPGGIKPLGAGGDLISSVILNNSTAWSGNITLTNHSQISRGEYLNAAPYSTYMLHFEPWGDIALDGSVLMRYNTISLDIITEGLTGLAALEVWGGSELITRKIAQLGVNMGIAQILHDFSDMSLGSVAVGAIAGAAATKFNPSQIWENVKQIVTGHKIADKNDLGTNILSGIESYNASIETKGANGSLISYIGTYIAAQNYFSTGPFLKITRFNQVSANNSELGSPLCAIRTINTLTGFVKCADADHNIQALEPEKASISDFLTTGFYYE